MRTKNKKLKKERNYSVTERPGMPAGKFFRQRHSLSGEARHLGSKIIFAGSSDFSAIILERLCQTNYKPALVITVPDKTVGRKKIITPPPLKISAKKHQIPVLQPEKIESIKEDIRNFDPVLIIVAAYGKIISREILVIPKKGCLNVHPSLLPRWRGPSPIQYTILEGEETTGVSIILMDEKIDHGPIISKSKIKYEQVPRKRVEQVPRKRVQISKMTYSELHDELAEEGAKLLVETIPRWIRSEIKPRPQNEKEATYTKILKKDDGKINWRDPAKSIERKIRALNPWPGTFSEWQKNKQKKTIKILEAEVLKQTANGPFGDPGKTFLASDSKIAVQTSRNFLIIQKLQPEGGRPMSAEEFLRGHQDFIGTILQ